MEPDERRKRREVWHAVLRSVPCSMILVSQVDQMWIEAYNRRVAVAQDHESLSRTALQLAMEIASMRGLIEAKNPSTTKKMTAEKLSQEMQHLGLAQVIGGKKADDEDSINLNPNMVGLAMQVHKNLLCIPRAVEIILEVEARYGTKSCWHKMQRLAAVATKPSNAAMRVWTLESVLDQLNMNMLTVNEVTKNTLIGDKHHCGLIQLFEYKWSVAQG